MESNAEKEIKFTSFMEKAVLYFLYILFTGLFIFIALFESLKEALAYLMPQDPGEQHRVILQCPFKPQ